MRRATYGLGLVLAAVAWSACEFQSLTEAENQLARGPRRMLAFELPITRDTFGVKDLFDSLLDFRTITLPDSLMAVAIDTVTLSAGNLVGVTVSNVVFEDTVTLPPIWQQVDANDLDLGTFEDAVRAATLNTAFAVTRVSNTADAPLTLVNFKLALVPIVNGVLDSVGGQPAFETDAGGNPIFVNIVDAPGDTTFLLGRLQVGKTATFSAAALVDRLVDRMLAGDSIAVVAVGDLVVGDGTAISINPGSSLVFKIEPLIGIDLTLPVTGVAVRPDSNLFSGGLDLDTALTDDLVGRVLDSVGVKIIVDNGLPFALEVVAGIVSGTITGDVFVQPNSVVDTIAVRAGGVGGTGRVTQASRDTISVVVSANEVRQVLGSEVTIGVRITLRPPTGGRAAVQSQDHLILDIRAGVWAAIGGAR